MKPRRLTGRCPECGGALHTLEGDYFEEAQHQPEYDNGPTGHGDLCLSDADPGL
jgi:hypothetical protein